MLPLPLLFILILYSYINISWAVNELELNSTDPLAPNDGVIEEPQSNWAAEKFEIRRRSEDGELPPHLWAIDIQQYRDFCYLTPDQVGLWLPNKSRTEQSNQLIIKNSQTQQEIELRWPTNEMIIAWPSKRLSIQSDHTYLIKTNHDLNYKTIIMHQIPAEHNTIAQQANWMKQRGCLSQANRLLKEHANQANLLLKEPTN